MTPDEDSAMNLGIFFDAVAVAGRSELVGRAKSALIEMMHGESTYLARFARAIDLFEGASAGMLTSIMASVGVASGLIHIKKSGTFPIVHGIRTLAIDYGLSETPTARRISSNANTKRPSTRLPSSSARRTSPPARCLSVGSSPCDRCHRTRLQSTLTVSSGSSWRGATSSPTRSSSGRPTCSSCARRPARTALYRPP